MLAAIWPTSASRSRSANSLSSCKLLFNQPAKIERRRQLFAKKFQRCIGFSRNHGAVRADLQGAKMLFSPMDRKRFFCAHCGWLHVAGRGAIEIERQMNLGQLQLFRDPPFGE